MVTLCLVRHTYRRVSAGGSKEDRVREESRGDHGPKMGRNVIEGEEVGSHLQGKWRRNSPNCTAEGNSFLMSV